MLLTNALSVFTPKLPMAGQEIAHVSFRDFVHQQQFLHWQFGKRGQPPDAQEKGEPQKPRAAEATS